jgi:hypothetical protein
MLALDRNGDGAIGHGGEISFIDDVPGATSDLEGLAAFDSDQDGQFDVDDRRYAEFLVWRDVNQDGVSQSDELASLADHGIVAIDLTRASTGATTIGARDNVITATSEFTRADGSKGIAGDVALASEFTQIAFAPPSAGEPLAIELREPLPIDTSAADESAAYAGESASELPIDQVDRSADNGRRAHGAASSPDSVDPAPLEIVDPSVADSVDPGAPPSSEWREDPDERPMAARRRASRDPGDEQEPAPRRAPRRWSDLGESAFAESDEVDAIGASRAAPSALHDNLSSVVRRRLQMIEAMASFTPEGASMLELQPRRKVDPRTLELLTSVPEIRVA